MACRLTQLLWPARKSPIFPSTRPNSTSLMNTALGMTVEEIVSASCHRRRARAVVGAETTACPCPVEGRQERLSVFVHGPNYRPQKWLGCTTESLSCWLLKP